VTLRAILFVAIGMFSLAGAMFNWDWFMNDRRAAFFVSVFGRTGARVFYALLGIALIGIGILFGLGRV